MTDRNDARLALIEEAIGFAPYDLRDPARLAFQELREALAAPAEGGQGEECFCDRTGLGVKGVSCGDCPRDYIAPPAASVDVEALRELCQFAKRAADEAGRSDVIALANKLIDSAGGAKGVRDAYEGAREDLLDWKGRAQRAERTLRGLGYTGIDASEAPQPAEGDEAVDDPADWPECSGNPGCCPENEGYGCCKPNSEAVEDEPPCGFIKVRDAIRGVVAVSKVFPGDIIAEEYGTRPAATAVVPDGWTITKSALFDGYCIDSHHTSPPTSTLIEKGNNLYPLFAMLAAAPKGGVVDAKTQNAIDNAHDNYLRGNIDATTRDYLIEKAKTAALATGEQP